VSLRGVPGGRVRALYATALTRADAGSSFPASALSTCGGVPRSRLPTLRRSRNPPLAGTASRPRPRLALETGDLERADRLSRAAAGAYGREHPRIADLLYDLAVHALARGRAGRAVLMLERVLAVRTGSAERWRCWRAPRR
jgi:hypothetical protein